MMNETVSLPIIGEMCSPFVEKFGIPRQPNLVNSISYIVMQAPYDDLNGFLGLEQFSHLWLLWQFHDNKRNNSSNQYQPLIRPPRLGGNQKMGVFASRSMYRPAPIGLSVVEFVDVKRIDGQTRVYVRGADLLNGTPILDIKPYLAYADALPQAQSGYAQYAPVLLAVEWSEQAMAQQSHLLSQQLLLQRHIVEIEQILSQNPKPAYQQDAEKIYGLLYADVNVRFCIAEDRVNIVAVQSIGSEGGITESS